METDKLLEFMSLAEKLKCNARHSWTSSGRRESVAEHTYRLMILSWLVKEEFPDYDMDRVLKLCLFHDMGEAVTGDIPCFEKKTEDEITEEQALKGITELLPQPYQKELQGIFSEICKKETPESRLLQAMDKMEALIQHNEAPIRTWLPLEYELQLTYGQEQARGIPYMKKLRDAVYQDSLDKIAKEGNTHPAGKGNYKVSDNPEKLSLKRVTELLSQTYWAKGRSREEIQKAMENSRAYGVYTEDGYMVGYARVVTDNATTFYLCDVIIDEAYRHRGLGTLLMDKIMEDVGHLHGILHTEDAMGFYRKYGFQAKSVSDETLMEKEREHY